MSITFYLATMDDDGVTRPACTVDHMVCPETFCPELADPREHYCSHMFDGKDDCATCGASLNLSNTNAAMVLGRLGVEFDYCGVLTGADLLGRALVGNVGADDEGAAPTVDRSEGGATLVDCGLPRGYFAHRLGILADLATMADARGCLVAWA